MTDVPRDDKGWPLLGPCAMTDIQLVKEAYRWHNAAMDTGPHTVSGHEWKKYTTELVRRNLMTQDQADRYADPEELEWLRSYLVQPALVKKRWWWPW